MKQIEMRPIEERVILDLCGGTGDWSRPYQEAGYDVRIVTWPENDARLWPSRPCSHARIPSEFESVEDLPRIHGILAAPVCTMFSGSGALRRRTDEQMIKALGLVDACLRIIYATNPEWWALENPVGKLRKWIGPPAMSFQPHEYGDPYTKRTLLWGRFNTNLRKTPVEPERVCSQGSWLMKLGGKSDRTKELRSMTPPGFARAFFEANP